MLRRSGRKEVGTGDETGLGQLITDIGKGDRTAFAELYRVTSPQLFGLALRLLRRRDWAEECVHDAFLRIWQEAVGYEAEKGPAFGWMATILRNGAMERLRRYRREFPADEREGPEAEEEIAQSLARLEASEQGRAMARALQQIDPEPRSFLALAYWEGASLDELARRSGRPIGMIKAAVRGALVQLKGSLRA